MLKRDERALKIAREIEKTRDYYVCKKWNRGA